MKYLHHLLISSSFSDRTQDSVYRHVHSSLQVCVGMCAICSWCVSRHVYTSLQVCVLACAHFTLGVCRHVHDSLQVCPALHSFKTAYRAGLYVLVLDLYSMTVKYTKRSADERDESRPLEFRSAFGSVRKGFNSKDQQRRD